MTQEHKSAADVAKTDLWRAVKCLLIEVDPSIVTYICQKLAVFDQAIQTETSTLQEEVERLKQLVDVLNRTVAAEALALRAENGRLRTAIMQFEKFAAHKTGGLDRIAFFRYLANRDKFKSADTEVWNTVADALETFSQTTPTGISDEILRWAAAGLMYINTQAKIESQMALRKAYEASSPETIKLLESIDDAPEP